jgi:two-component system, OmpR family, response regulator
MNQILLVEDDPMLGSNLKLNLELEGFKVDWAHNLAEAFATNGEKPFQLALLDLGLPDGSGLNFCRQVREQGSRLPIIILTAQSDEDSVVDGLSAGADDYVKKPFSNRELVARIRTALRAPQVREEQTRVGNLTVLMEQRRVYVGSEEVTLNRREFDVLKILVSRPGVVVTREMIINQLGESAEQIFDRTVDSHISHLRAKLKKVKECNIRIKSEYGVGYRIAVLD